MIIEKDGFNLPFSHLFLFVPLFFAPVSPFFYLLLNWVFGLIVCAYSILILCWLISQNSLLCFYSSCFRILTYICNLPIYPQVILYHLSYNGKTSEQHTSISSLPGFVLLLSYFLFLHVINSTYIVIIFAWASNYLLKR